MPEQFRLIASERNPLWIDVVYPDPIGPKYMISVKNWSCTCMGDTIGKAQRKQGKEREDCKHLKDLADKIRIAK